MSLSRKTMQQNQMKYSQLPFNHITHHIYNHDTCSQRFFESALKWDREILKGRQHFHHSKCGLSMLLKPKTKWASIYPPGCHCMLYFPSARLQNICNANTASIYLLSWSLSPLLSSSSLSLLFPKFPLPRESLI